MNEGEMVNNIQLESNQCKLIQSLFLLTNKPTKYVANVDEGKIAEDKRNH